MIRHTLCDSQPREGVLQDVFHTVFEVCDTVTVTKTWLKTSYMLARVRPFVKLPRHRPQCSVRWKSNVKPPGKFKVLFFGRDEFSCAVLAALHAASGRSLALRLDPWSQFSSFIDVWQELHIATNPNKRHMRNGTKIQTCESFRGSQYIS